MKNTIIKILLLILFCITGSAQTVSTIAGASGIGFGQGGYSGDGGLATNAMLKNPHGVFVDVADNVYIADFSNSVIRYVNATTGIISTVAGNPTRGYYGDGGLATSAGMNHPAAVFVDAASNMYITDAYNNRIRKVTAGTMSTQDFVKEPTQVYPNPITNVLQIESNITFETMALYDITGKQIISQDFVKEINTANLAKGFYLLRLITDDGEVVVKKVVKE